jgi:50S ribosomal protein L16 3-hydroxylase
LLGELSVGEFLSRHWQKRPLLVRGALRDWAPPVDREQLLGLAARPGVGSRLVTMRDWSVRHGPFPTEELRGLPTSGWTLLIQELDRHVDGLAALLDRFRFIPNWRIDDVMVSYAPDGGGVGPHIDRYDVFLVQAAGERRWRIASRPVEEERLLPVELPVLAEFSPDEEWLLEPGDMLYLPPRIAHEGIAVGESVTCSVGFRTPDPRELSAGFLRQLAPEAFDGIRYSDPDLAEAERLGESPPAARGQLREAARQLFDDEVAFDRWLGRMVTEPRRNTRPNPSPCSLDELRGILDRGGSLRRSAIPHFVWQRERDGAVQLFVGGERYDLGSGGAPAAELLCGRRRLDGPALAPLLERDVLAGVLLDLVARGFLAPHAS